MRGNRQRRGGRPRGRRREPRARGFAEHDDDGVGGELGDASAESKAARAVARARIRGGGGGGVGAAGRRQRRRHRNRHADVHVFALAVRGRGRGRFGRGSGSDSGFGWGCRRFVFLERGRRFVFRERGAAVDVRVEVVEGRGGGGGVGEKSTRVVSDESVERGECGGGGGVGGGAERLETRAKIRAARGVERGGEARARVGGDGAPGESARRAVSLVPLRHRAQGVVGGVRVGARGEGGEGGDARVGVAGNAADEHRAGGAGEEERGADDVIGGTRGEVRGVRGGEVHAGGVARARRQGGRARRGGDREGYRRESRERRRETPPRTTHRPRPVRYALGGIKRIPGTTRDRGGRSMTRAVRRVPAPTESARRARDVKRSRATAAPPARRGLHDTAARARVIPIRRRSGPR